MYSFSKYLLLLIFLFKPIYSNNCIFKTHKFYLLPISKETNNNFTDLKGLKKFDYLLILKPEPKNDDNADKYNMVFNASFPININIELSNETIYEFNSLENFCIKDLVQAKEGKYVNILGTLIEISSNITIFGRIWIKIEQILLNKNLELKSDLNKIDFYVLTNHTVNNEKNTYILMEKLSLHNSKQIFQIIRGSLYNEDYSNYDYWCEDNPKAENELSIGDSLYIIDKDRDKLRDSFGYRVFVEKDNQKQNFNLNIMASLVCLIFENNELKEKC